MSDLVTLLRLWIATAALGVAGWAARGIPAPHRHIIAEHLTRAAHDDPEFCATLESWLR